MNAATAILLLALGLLIGLAAGYLLARGRAGGTRDVATLFAPASATLAKVESQLREVERDRASSYAALREQIAALHRVSADLGAQTRALVGALRAPQVRGRWGEVQLQRIVELAGMVEHCDFDTQVPASGDDGGVRPDLVIRLAGGRAVPVDAKVPFAAWLEAMDTTDERRRADLMAAHARALRGHVDTLAGKAYWRHFRPAPEFVVLFVPGEPLLDAALRVDPSITEHAFAKNVIIATPTTLIALLRTVAYAWRSEQLSESAEQVRALGAELYGRLATLGGHLSRLGASLGRSVDAYNAAVRSVESRVLVTARRFADLGVTGDALPAPEQLVTAPVRPQSPELVADGDQVIPLLPERATMSDVAGAPGAAGGDR